MVFTIQYLQFSVYIYLSLKFIDPTVKLWEVYKIHQNNSEAILLNYGNWTLQRSLITPTEEIWARRIDLKGQFFRASALPNKPYVTVVEEGCTSQDCFQGMYPDVWHNLQKLMNFTYKIYLPFDNSWGM